MSERSRRTGLIAKKVGMTQVFDSEGMAIPVTLLKADENYVLAQKTLEKDGYTSVVLGFGERKPSRVSKPVRGTCSKANIKPVAKIKEFRVSESALLEPGRKLSINHFAVEQLIDVQGISVGKGFAGAMKRWNFAGLEASHGVSVSHRSHGSTGQRQDPGKTFKGKKMAGHYGAETTTVQNIRIALIDEELGLIGVNGSVPGKNGSYVYLTDAMKTVMPGSVKYPAALVEQQSNEGTPPATETNVVENSPNETQNSEV